MATTWNRFSSALRSALAEWQIDIDPDQLHRLFAHYQAVIEANRVMNLTRITKPVEAAVKHYADSMALLPWARKRPIGPCTVLDVGTGAGFPAVPLAVMRPEWTVTAMDATRKKIDFLRKTAAAIGLTNLRCQHAHSRHWHTAETFQLVVFRALAKMPMPLREAARYVDASGRAVAYAVRSPANQDRSVAPHSPRFDILAFEERYDYELELAGDRIARSLYVYRKQGP